MLNSKQDGFGLIEAMVAVVVLSVGLLGAAMMQANMTASTNLARQRGEALFVAKDLMEKMRGGGVCSAEADVIQGGSATYNYDVDCDLASSVATITVDWNDAAGETNTVVLQSQI